MTTPPCQQGFAHIAALEAQLRAGEPVELELRHHFASGVYGRELHIPANTVVVGMIHKTTNLNVCSKGRISVFSSDGQLREFVAGDHIVSPPGTQRAVMALEDTIWTTFHATELTDLDAIEKVFVCRDYLHYLAYCDTLKLEE